MATRAWQLFFFLVWALVGAVCVTSNARGHWMTFRKDLGSLHQT